ncbi:hypothetical protein PR048_002343 [Dryococelus australis]|uniref:Uncharacterized protein n=1 Tax=Dryococelus australis TaxID=614101 RepID=A0ABQ9IK14_9NEOP|nr:hypothetical protein PR048_002343 [Dryococelus australis]
MTLRGDGGRVYVWCGRMRGRATRRVEYYCACRRAEHSRTFRTGEIWTELSQEPTGSKTWRSFLVHTKAEVGIVQGGATGRRVFSGISLSSRLCIPALRHTQYASPSPALNTSMLRAAQGIIIDCSGTRKNGCGEKLITSVTGTLAPAINSSLSNESGSRYSEKGRRRSTGKKVVGGHNTGYYRAFLGLTGKINLCVACRRLAEGGCGRSEPPQILSASYKLFMSNWALLKALLKIHPGRSVYLIFSLWVSYNITDHAARSSLVGEEGWGIEAVRSDVPARTECMTTPPAGPTLP